MMFKGKRKWIRGFTLIELMIVVVIIGVLAALAVYSVTKYINSSKTAEAREIIMSIKAGQEAYYDETFRYLGVGTGADDYYPSDNLNGSIGIMWGGAPASTCKSPSNVNCDVGYKTLGVSPSGIVRFRYATVAGTTGGVPSLGSNPAVTGYNLPTSTSAPWYVVKAASDLKKNGAVSVFVSSSFQSEIYEQNPGE